MYRIFKREAVTYRLPESTESSGLVLGTCQPTMLPHIITAMEPYIEGRSQKRGVSRNWTAPT